jgi:AcrR family transcriptional regulator
MEKETDLRIVRTQQLIKNAFYELLGTVGFEKITVQSLVTKAAVNRSTFYLHYTDKYDLLNKLEAEILDGMQKVLNSIDFESVFNFVYDGEPMPHIVRILEYAKANEQFYTLVLGPKGDPSFIGKMGEFIRSMMASVMSRYGILDKLLIPAHYAFPMFVAVITSFLNEWVRTGMRETPYELAGIMTLVIRDLPRGLIDLAP